MTQPPGKTPKEMKLADAETFELKAYKAEAVETKAKEKASLARTLKEPTKPTTEQASEPTSELMKKATADHLACLYAHMSAKEVVQPSEAAIQAAVNHRLFELNREPLAREAIYAAVAERRTAFDTMLWQVPALGATAISFLYTIGLTQDNHFWAKIVALGAALVVAISCLVLMHKQRQAEMLDAEILRGIELGRLEIFPVHGESWATAKKQIKPKADRSAYGGMFYLFLTACILTVILIICTFSGSLSSDNNPNPTDKVTTNSEELPEAD